MSQGIFLFDMYLKIEVCNHFKSYDIKNSYYG